MKTRRYKHKKRLSHKKTRKGAMKGGAMSIDKIIEKTELNFDEKLIQKELKEKYSNAPEKICIGKQAVKEKIAKYTKQRNFPDKSLEVLKDEEMAIITKYKNGEKINKLETERFKKIQADMKIILKIRNLSMLGDIIIEIGLETTKEIFHKKKKLILLDCARSDDLKARHAEEKKRRAPRDQLDFVGWFGVPCANGKTMIADLIKEGNYLKQFLSTFDPTKTNREFHTIVSVKINELRRGPLDKSQLTQKYILNNLLNIINTNTGKGWHARDVIAKLLKDEKKRMTESIDGTLFKLVDRNCILDDEVIELLDTIENLENIKPYLDNRNTIRPGPENYGDILPSRKPAQAWNTFELSPENPVHEEPDAMERKSFKKSPPKPRTKTNTYKRRFQNKVGPAAASPAAASPAAAPLLKKRSPLPPPKPGSEDDYDDPDAEEWKETMAVLRNVNNEPIYAVPDREKNIKMVKKKSLSPRPPPVPLKIQFNPFASNTPPRPSNKGKSAYKLSPGQQKVWNETESALDALERDDELQGALEDAQDQNDPLIRDTPPFVQPRALPGWEDFNTGSQSSIGSEEFYTDSKRYGVSTVGGSKKRRQRRKNKSKKYKVKRI